jgi:hypothetical protein
MKALMDRACAAPRVLAADAFVIRPKLPSP